MIFKGFVKAFNKPFSGLRGLLKKAFGIFLEGI
jgi:hypothetical protein